MRTRHYLIAALAALLTGSCTEEVDTSVRYVFKHDSVLSYLQKHEAYSQYASLLEHVPISKLSRSTLAQLLAARGHYTVFAPTNEAIDEYLQTVWQENPDLMTGPTWEDFLSEHKRDSIRQVIVYNSIIDSGDHDEAYQTWDFPITDRAEFPRPNLLDHKLAVHNNIEGFPDSLYINGDCPISLLQRDILCLNGIIHQMEKVIAPKDITAATYIQEMLDQEQDGYLVMCKALQACGLMDTLSKVRDEAYEERYQRGLVPDLPNMNRYFYETGTAFAPRHRKYGFTIFAETDDFWRSQGLDPRESSATLLPKLQQWILDNRQYSQEYDTFTTGEDYQSPQNLLYQWTTYHVLGMRIPTDRLVFHVSEYGYTDDGSGNLSIPVCEYYPTLGKRRLIKIYESPESQGIYLNRCPRMDRGRHGTGHETGCDPDKVGCRIGNDSPMAIVNDMVNCCIYPIDAPLACTDQVRNNLGRERIRFDGMSLFPEAMNNDIRLNRAPGPETQYILFPNTVTSYNYYEGLQMNEQTNMVYYNAFRYSWPNMNTDEIKAGGRFEIMVALPPVPRRGTYELRYEVTMTTLRGVLQIYFGTDPGNLPVAGIPIDLSRTKDAPIYGWEPDTDDDAYNAEIDKNMRNKGVMKGAQSVGIMGSTTETQRQSSIWDNLRHIVFRGPMEPDKTYYMKLKSVLNDERREFFLDYLELCPKEVYDNPETPEDIW